MPALTRYDGLSEHLCKKLIDLSTDGLSLTLHTSSFTAETTDDVYADLNAELPTANGYTAGGQALTGVTVSRTGSATTLSADAVVWTASGGAITAMYAVLRDTTANKLLAYGPVQLNEGDGVTPEDMTATDGNTFTVSSASLLVID